MTRRHDVRKRRQWEERFERHRSGGLTVADFCAKERVSVNTFYYWAKRIDRRWTAARSAESATASERPRKLSRPPRGATEGFSAVAAKTAVVRFRLGTTVEVLVPASCLDVIRSLAQWLQGSLTERADAFQEVVIGPR
ncbi:MAG: hypothetical protein PVSMB1_07860 [Gemmatimonadaceae bacterium]